MVSKSRQDNWLITYKSVNKTPSYRDRSLLLSLYDGSLLYINGLDEKSSNFLYDLLRERYAILFIEGLNQDKSDKKIYRCNIKDSSTRISIKMHRDYVQRLIDTLDRYGLDFDESGSEIVVYIKNNKGEQINKIHIEKIGIYTDENGQASLDQFINIQ
ncbi:MAG: hypothetical protein ARM1_0598 [Candidatus Micrarchaeota archaeon]|nr:MAG: hypothetical protein ARM1_0598 [Candidatus Micrarchaeota archaeon]